MGVLTFCVLLVTVSSTSSFVLVDNEPHNRTVIKNLTVPNGGQFGIWGKPEFCAVGTFAVGYEMKIERPQFFGDDTEVNGVKLLCDSLDGTRYGGEITSTVGDWGNGRPDRPDVISQRVSTILCFRLPSMLKHHRMNRGDDTGVNWIKFTCNDFAFNENPYELDRAPGTGQNGTYGAWRESCDADSSICGINTRVQLSQAQGDDTALNDVILYCCST